jgi:hypothetical protein
LRGDILFTGFCDNDYQILIEVFCRFIKFYSSRNLELYKIRTELEKRGQKEIAYEQCVVDHSFIMLWFPWTLQNTNSEIDEKTQECQEKLDMKDISSGL